MNAERDGGTKRREKCVMASPTHREAGGRLDGWPGSVHERMTKEEISKRKKNTHWREKRRREDRVSENDTGTFL